MPPPLSQALLLLFQSALILLDLRLSPCGYSCCWAADLCNSSSLHGQLHKKTHKKKQKTWELIHRSLLRKDRVNPRQSACLFSLFFSLSLSSSVSSPSPCLLFLRHRAICPQHCSRFNLIQPLRSARFHSDHHRDRMVELSVSSPDSGAHLPHLCLSVLPHRHWSPQTRQKHLLLSLCSTMPQSLLYPIILALCSRTLPFLFFKQTAVLSLNLKLLLYNHGIFVFFLQVLETEPCREAFVYANGFAVAYRTG